MKIFTNEALVPSVLVAACAQPARLRVITAPRGAGFPQEKSALVPAGMHVGRIPGGASNAKTYTTKQQSKSPKLDGFRGVPPRGRPV